MVLYSGGSINRESPVQDRKKADAPVVLVGNKCDDDNTKVISYESGNKLVNNLGMDYFTETSAKTGKNVQETFLILVSLCKTKLDTE